MYKFKIKPNTDYLKQTIQGYYHGKYITGDSKKRLTIGSVENTITTLKNSFGSTNESILAAAKKRLIDILNEDLKLIYQVSGKHVSIVCVVPRAKKENFYNSNQLYFKRAIKESIEKNDFLKDGTEFIKRKIHTRTTHLDRSGHGGLGKLPYPGITNDTCEISEKAAGKDILLIDDLYTKSVNIDEDVIQALLDHGAKSVLFYSYGKTYNPEFNQEEIDEKIEFDSPFSTDLPNRFIQTYSLIRMNKSINQISEIKKVTTSTIIEHIVEISRILGADSVADFKPSHDVLNKVRTAISIIGNKDKLKPIFEELNESVSYDEIKLSLIFI